MKSKRRFIAGAVCPRCGQMDKLVVYQENDSNYRACVACDFVEEQSDTDESAPSPVPTRVSQGDVDELEVQSINVARIDAIELKQ